MEPLKIRVSLEPLESAVYFDKGLQSLAGFCKGISSRGVLLAEENIARIHGSHLLAKLPPGYELIPFPSGEAAKTRETKQFLENELLRRKLGRDSLVAAAGGGTATDLAGFAAATYMRGVPLVLIPTTLLGMADAAIGGKNGVNVPSGKNLIGTTFLPKAVFIDFDLLHTLPASEWINGLAEILKAGLIAKEAIWKLCEEAGINWKNSLHALARDAIQAKIEVIEQDPYEKGYRRILNFGHTVGHALEKLSSYKMAHGEAVSTGCMAESFLSRLIGLLPEDDFERICALYKKLNIGVRLPPSFRAADFLDALTLDKKAANQEARFVLIDRIGHAAPFGGAYCKAVGKKELDALTDWIVTNGKRTD